jgi:hypothetical protein
MHPFHMLGVAGVFGGSLFSAMHGLLVVVFISGAVANPLPRSRVSAFCCRFSRPFLFSLCFVSCIQVFALLVPVIIVV